jgi:hypothetical protein
MVFSMVQNTVSIGISMIITGAFVCPVDISVASIVLFDIKAGYTSTIATRPLRTHTRKD